MRKTTLLLGCVALAVAGGAMAGDQHRYRVDFHFAKSDTDLAGFARDKNLCIRHTSDAMPYGGTFLGAHNGNWGAGEIYKYNAAAFYDCMTAKGYRSTPNGPFAISLSTWL
jgi:hypothetical protein